MGFLFFPINIALTDGVANLKPVFWRPFIVKFDIVWWRDSPTFIFANFELERGHREKMKKGEEDEEQDELGGHLSLQGSCYELSSYVRERIEKKQWNARV